jgi:hypothetical protein
MYVNILDIILRPIFFKHNVSETESVTVLKWKKKGVPTLVGPLEKASLLQWTSDFVQWKRLPFSKGPTRVGPPFFYSPEDGDRSSLWNAVF